MDFKKHFLDSGAFSQWRLSEEYAKENHCDRFDYYHTDEFFKYLDDYATFIKKYKRGIDVYANLDVIGSPELSWRNLKLLENKHGLRPMPVIHVGHDIKWLKRMLKDGYKYIGLGGVAKSVNALNTNMYLDTFFREVCRTSDYSPLAKIHGFGLTSFSKILRYPFYSVDSTVFIALAAYGMISIPRRKNGKYVFTGREGRPIHICVSEQPSKKMSTFGIHFNHYRGGQKRNILEWIESTGIPWGESVMAWEEIKDKKGEVTGEELTSQVLTPGISNDAYCRCHINMIYFERWRRALPHWPRKLWIPLGFGL